jgi:hypothetical protein
VAENRIKRVLKFSIILYEIMFFIALYWWICSKVSAFGQMAALRSLGIFTGVIFLFLCPIAPVCGVICGFLGYRGLKKLALKQEVTGLGMWKLISLAEILLGVLMAFPCMTLFLGACSGRI